MFITSAASLSTLLDSDPGCDGPSRDGEAAQKPHGKSHAACPMEVQFQAKN